MPRRTVPLIGAALLLSACATDQSLFFATHMKFGVSATATGKVLDHAVLGYDRYEGVVLQLEEPEVQHGLEGGGKEEKLPENVPSVFACVDVSNRFFVNLGLSQEFAAGKAAKLAAKRYAKNGRDCAMAGGQSQ